MTYLIFIIVYFFISLVLRSWILEIINLELSFLKKNNKYIKIHNFLNNYKYTLSFIFGPFIILYEIINVIRFSMKGW
jgi:small-conductance mechanosensitive channel